MVGDALPVIAIAIVALPEIGGTIGTINGTLLRQLARFASDFALIHARLVQRRTRRVLNSQSPFIIRQTESLLRRGLPFSRSHGRLFAVAKPFDGTFTRLGRFVSPCLADGGSVRLRLWRDSGRSV